MDVSGRIHAKRILPAIAAATLAGVALAGCGSSGSHGSGVHLLVHHPSVAQVKRAFASQGVPLRRVAVRVPPLNCGHVVSHARCNRVRRAIQKELRGWVELSWGRLSRKVCTGAALACRRVTVFVKTGPLPQLFAIGASIDYIEPRGEHFVRSRSIFVAYAPGERQAVRSALTKLH